jgi:hypothetical protein
VAAFDDLDKRDFFAPRVFVRTAKWLADSGVWDKWFCYVDSFDVYESFHCPEPYTSMYTDENATDPDLIHWPYYGPVDAHGLPARVRAGAVRGQDHDGRPLVRARPQPP